MVKPMTLDELIEYFIDMAERHSDLTTRTVLAVVIKHIRDNRDALEEGMRGTLKAKRDDDTGLWYLLTQESLLTEYSAPKQWWVEFAEALGLRAEFVEDDDG